MSGESRKYSQSENLNPVREYSQYENLNPVRQYSQSEVRNLKSEAESDISLFLGAIRNSTLWLQETNETFYLKFRFRFQLMGVVSCGLFIWDEFQ
ncbi:hypothetical protein QL285_065623 [Trifolium repens]|nr:hypothetical protein QL285_065623 [Trifolium repens]